MKNPAPTVLLADDDGVALLVAQAALESGGFEVSAAGDGVMAVEEFQRQLPDVVILDVMMPRLDGFEACRQIRGLPAGKDVPILIMTGRDDVDAVARAYAVGATDFASKGISSRLLIERVRFLLREYQARRALVVSRARLSMVQKMARIGHWEIDGSGRTLHASRMVQDLFAGEAGGARHLAQLVAGVRPEEGVRVLEAFRGWQATRGAFRLETVLRDDTRLHLVGATTPGTAAGPAPTLTLALQDITELRSAQRQVHQLAHFDTITGLANRRHALDWLAETVARRPADRPLWLHSIRLRGLDRLQLSLGQAAHDAALLEAVRLVTSAAELRDGDTFAHLGGGEFALCRVDCDSPVTAAVIAERVTHAVSAPLSGADWTASLQVATGIASWPEDGGDAESLLENARAAAGQAATGPESGYAFFCAETQQRARRRMELETALHGAIERGEIWMAFQPRVTLADGVIHGSEALMRWTHPSLGPVPPLEFIPLAEETGLIAGLGAWALGEACRHTAAWRSETGRELIVSVNASAHQLRHPKLFVEEVLAALKASALPANALQLELTESAFIDVSGESLDALRELRGLGVSLALDDFGTGYSSLGYLRRLPVDCLKVDRSFVSDLPEDATAVRMLQAILGIAAALRLSTVAEGVETDAQYGLLAHQGCQEAQGYLISRPVPAADFGRLLASPNFLHEERRRA